MNMEETMMEIWEEAYELYANFADLNDEDIVDLRDTMKDRAERIMVMSGHKFLNGDE